MKTYNVLISETALASLRDLELNNRDRIKRHLNMLAEDPYSRRPKADIRKLKGSFDPVLFRLRIGDYRAINSVKGKDVRVTEIIHRSKGYKWLDEG